MPAFSFEALDAQGRSRKGTLEADSARAARSLLRAQALVPLLVEPVGTAGASAGSIVLFNKRVFSSSGLAIFTRQLAGLVGAGLPLERALSALADESEDDRQHALLATLRSEVNAGATFARALAQHPREFSPVFNAVIAAGEQTGNLALVLERLADDQEESQSLRGKLIGASLYPAIVTLVAIVIVIFLVSYVVPQVASVFVGTKRSLPFLTVAMLSISAAVRHYGWAILGVVVLIVLAVRTAYARPLLRMRIDAGWLRLPLVGRLARGYNSARFAGTLALLASAGVPILRALQAAAETLHNQAMRADAMDALVLVREGAPLASALAQKKRFPGLLAMFARLGEQTGELPLMLQRAATQLSTEVQRRAMALATILEPLLIVVMGLVVMMIVLAVLLPIIQLNQFVK